MSWPAAAFLIVAVILALGWLAYERRRPSSRMVAVVATLAAVAALGRDAFVALPDVKPITAMTFVVGFALGPLPGFSVGAMGMLASNVLLGQGPYTPWQMAAWGGVGLVGAAVGRLTGRRLGRGPLAVACALSALAAKEVMNLYTWTLGASHTPAAFVAVAGAALPFDVTDIVATLLFALIFAPELARLLGRVRSRMDVAWEAAATAPSPPAPGPPAAGGAPPAPAKSFGSVGVAGCLGAALLTGALFLGGSPGRASAVAPAGGVSRELAYLYSAQDANGGFGAARGQASSELYSAWVAMGFAAAGRDPLSVRKGGHSVLDALREEASSLQGAGDLERTILALHACGVSVRSLPGGDPVGRLLAFRDADGSFGHQSNLTAFAIFALRAAGYSVRSVDVRTAGRWLAAQQDADGGFGFGRRGAGSDVDDTAAALQGLIDAGAGAGASRGRATSYLVSSQNPDGGFPQQPGGESNAQSTAWAVQGLQAAGRDPGTVRRPGSRSALGYLETLLAPDGSVRYSRTGAQTPVWVTAQALTALARKPFPIGPVPRVRAGAATVSAHAPAPAGPARPRRRPHSSAAARPSPAAPTGLARARASLDRLARSVGMLVGVLLAPELK